MFDAFTPLHLFCLLLCGFLKQTKVQVSKPALKTSLSLNLSIQPRPTSLPSRSFLSFKPKPTQAARPTFPHSLLYLFPFLPMARIAPRRPIILPAQTNLQPTSPSPSLLVTDRQAPHVNTSSTSRRPSSSLWLRRSSPTAPAPLAIPFPSTSVGFNA